MRKLSFSRWLEEYEDTLCDLPEDTDLYKLYEEYEESFAEAEIDAFEDRFEGYIYQVSQRETWSGKMSRRIRFKLEDGTTIVAWYNDIHIGRDLPRGWVLDMWKGNTTGSNKDGITFVRKSLDSTWRPRSPSMLYCFPYIRDAYKELKLAYAKNNKPFYGYY